MRGRLVLGAGVAACALAVTAGAAIVSVSGQVQLIPAPPSVAFGALESNSTMFAFDERQNVTLPSALKVDITSPGTYDSSASLTPGTISAGTCVSSQFVHHDALGSGNPPNVLEGTVTTNADILGIVVRKTSLDASDFLGAPGTAYPTGASGRQLELDQTDVLIEQIDKRTVFIHSGVHTKHADQVRIITKCSAPPPGACTITSTIRSNFNGTPIAAGNYIWFNSVLKATGVPTSAASHITLTSQTITFTANGTPYSLTVPDSEITFSPSATTATTTFTAGKWQTTVPTSLSGNLFLSGLAFQLPVNFPGGINPVTWRGTFSADTAGVGFQWKWGAAVYTSFSTNYNTLGVTPADNSLHAGTPVNFKSFVIGGARGGGGSNFTGSYSATTSGQCP